jgi:methylenetetrahydrofolate--tRNA-(uracil-5-)-methyltransferase
MGALIHHITGNAEADTFQPMNVNFGLFPPLTEEIRKGRKGKRDRAQAYTTRAKAVFGEWLAGSGLGVAQLGVGSA